MASLGNVGVYIRVGKPYSAWQFFTQNKQPTSVSMTGVSTVPFSFALLFRNGVLNYRARCDGSGNWFFYDMDDSGTQSYTIITLTQDGPTGEEWVATVVGGTATVTKLFSATRAAAHAFVG